MKTIYLKLSNTCNLACKHCYVGKCQAEYMTGPILNAVLEEIDRMYIAGEDIEVILHGGEPMVSIQPSMLSILRTMNTFNIPVTMTTNLVYRLDNFKLSVIRCMKKNSESAPFICTSWDKDIRFKSSMQQRLWEDNVKQLFSLGVDIQVITTVTKVLIDTMTPEQLFEYFKFLGFKKVNFERLTVTGNAKNNTNIIPTNKEMREWLFKAYQINKDKYHFEIPLFDNLKWAKEGIYNGCRARQCTKNVITYNPDGSVATCPNIHNAKVRYLGRADGLYEVIDVLSAKNIYKNICMKEETRHNECYICPHFSTCNGDCFQLEWDKTGCPGLKEIMEVL